MVAAPIKQRDHVLGVLTVMTRQPRAFRPEEITLLTSIGQQIGIAVDSLRLAEEVRQQAERVAALQERERIGIELHDGLLQTLGYLYLKADQLEAAAAQHGFTDMAIELASYRTVLERASGDARRFIADLRETPPAPPKPLQLTLAEMVAAFQSESPMQVSVVGGDQPILLDPDRSAHVVRIAREALVNAAQHGQARRASVTCSWRDGLGELVIADDGLGFEADQAPGDGREHFGLTIMRARAARIGGQLRVDSAPGRGTRVHVTWPQAGS
jgi:two-component system nitrate/nitrite sensor histidine kinase NarX